MFRGTVLSQSIGVLGTIILAKIYGSEAFGLYGLYVSIYSFLSIVNTLELEKGIVILSSKKESKILMNSLFIIALLVPISYLIIYSIIQFQFQVITIELGIVLLSVLASILFSFLKIHESFFTFSKNFLPISNSKIFTSIFNIIFQSLLFIKFKNMGLIYGNIITLIFISIYYFKKNFSYLTSVKIREIKISLNSGAPIIKYVFPSSIVNSLALNIMPLLIITFFSLEEAGVYFLSLKILAIPLFLINSSISQAYYQKSQDLFKLAKEKLYDFSKQIVFINLVIMLIFIILINSLGIYFLEIIFDYSWENIRSITFILSFLILARSSFNPISNIILVLNKNHISFLFSCYLLFISLLSIYLGYISNDFEKTVISLSILGGLGYLILLVYFLKKLKNLKK